MSAAKTYVAPSIDTAAFYGRLMCCIMAPDAEKDAEIIELIQHIDLHTAKTVASVLEAATVPTVRTSLSQQQARTIQRVIDVLQESDLEDLAGDLRAVLAQLEGGAA